MANHKIVVGWQEFFSLPELGVKGVKAKIDTGAKTSSLHAFNIKKFEKNGKAYIRFEVHPGQRSKKNAVLCEAPLIDERKVKSSSGEEESRPVIKTKVMIANIEWEIELNLTNRDYMGLRMLLGREAMKNILVEPNKKLIWGKSV